MKLGLTWLCVGYGLWDMLFQPGGSIFLFSLKDLEAVDLLDRLRQMHLRLPHFLQASIETDNDHEIQFGKLRSRARAFACTEEAGRNLTGSVAIIDEADFIPILEQLITGVQPGVEAGGKLILVSASNKRAPASEFKRRWADAVAGMSNYVPVFLPWNARPDRDKKWYRNQEADYDEDNLWQNYPATPEQALAPRSSDKRFDPKWLMGWERAPRKSSALTLPGLIVYEQPVEGESYVVPADPAEGNPRSNPSAATVLNSKWEQAAVMSGQFEPSVFGGYLVELARWYNDATIVPERNNHGHTVILAIQNLGAGELLYVSPFDSRPGHPKYGWLSSPKMRTEAVNLTAKALKDGDVTLRDEATVNELVMLGPNARAPSGFNDDRAMTVIIGLAALKWPSLGGEGSVIDAYIQGVDPMMEIDRGGYV
jgi:hypothetical protein